MSLPIAGSGSDNAQSRTLQPTRDEIDEKPWRYIGYRGFAAYMASDLDCFIVRRFDKLFVRCVLYHQDRLSELEEDLEDLDRKYEQVQHNGREVNNGTVRDDLPDRKKLVNEIRSCPEEYYRLITPYSQLGSKRVTRMRCIQNVRNWLLRNHPGAISERETRFIQHDEDLISLVSKDQPKMRQLFEDWMILRTKLLFPIFRKRADDELGDVDRETLFYTSDIDVERFSSIAIFLAGSAMFIAPLWILQALDQLRQRLAVITSFIFLFLLVLTSSTLGKPFEVLAATAGYSAVLVVFLQFGVSAT